MPARKGTRSRSSKKTTSRRNGVGFMDAVRHPSRTGREVMDAATTGLERVGRTLEMSADFAQRAGRALQDVSESLLQLAKDVQPKKGAGRGRTTHPPSASTTHANGAGRTRRKGRASSRAGTTTTSGRSRASTTTSNRGSSASPKTTARPSESMTMRAAPEGDGPFTGIGA